MSQHECSKPFSLNLRGYRGWASLICAGQLRFLVCASLIVGGCGELVTPPILNQPPQASAGASRNVVTGDSVTLVGTASTDPDGDALSYLWQQKSGPEVGLTGALSVVCNFVPQTPGIYELVLTVSDGSASDEDSVFVFVDQNTNGCPISFAGDDLSVAAGATVVLEGNYATQLSSDAATVVWVQVQGTPVSLLQPNQGLASFVAPIIDQQEEILFELRVQVGDCVVGDVVTVTVEPIDEPAPDRCLPSDACDDQNPCTSDSCFDGSCVSAEVDCSDDSPCTIDTCEGGSCRHDPITCPDEQMCVEGSCAPSHSGCSRPLQFSAASYPSGDSNPREVRIADIDGDGTADVIVGHEVNDNIYATAALCRNPDSATKRLSILPGDGRGRFLPARTYAVLGGTANVAVSDVNSDGRLDVVTSNWCSASNGVLFGGANGIFEASQTQRFSSGNGPSGVAIDDVNHDGLLDILTANYSDGTLSIALANQDGANWTSSLIDVGNSPYSLATDDINADGCQDVLVSNYGSASMSILLGFCDGSFAAQRFVAVGNGPTQIGVGDFDRNGTIDAAVANYIDGTVTVRYGDGQGGFPTTTDFQVGPSPTGLTVSDIDCDGYDDVLTTVSGNGKVVLLLNQSTGTFSGQAFRAGNAPAGIAVADLDGDTDEDIIVSNYNDASVTVLLNRCQE